MGKQIKNFITIFAFIFVYVPPYFGLNIYETRLGENQTLNFIHESPNPDAIFNIDVFSPNSADPFYSNGTFIPTALLPSQGDRFFIEVERRETSLAVFVDILSIETVDTGVYITSLRAVHEGNIQDVIYEAIVDVIIPPGKANCGIVASNFSPDLNEVHCRATLNSFGEDLVCYQNEIKAPTRCQPVTTDEEIARVFWVISDDPIRCCSFEAGMEKDAESCTDFVSVNPRGLPFPTAEEDSSNTSIVSTVHNNGSEEPVYNKKGAYSTVVIGTIGFICGSVFDVPVFCVICLLYKRRNQRKERPLGRELNNNEREVEAGEMTPISTQDGPGSA